MIDVNLKITETLHKLYPTAPHPSKLIIGDDKKDMYSRNMHEIHEADFVGYKINGKFLLVKNRFGASLLVVDYINGTSCTIHD